MKALSIVLICFGTLVLLAYPFVLMGNLMALANLPAGNPPAGATTGIEAFIWASTLYPLPWLAALIGSIWCLVKGSAKKALFWQAALVGYVILVGALLLAA